MKKPLTLVSVKGIQRDQSCVKNMNLFWSRALSSDIDIEYKKSYSMIHLKRFIWKVRVREPFRR